ncbi:MAG: hypothetical protein ABSG88_15265 [Bradyrhizobium sp.]
MVWRGWGFIVVLVLVFWAVVLLGVTDTAGTGFGAFTDWLRTIKVQYHLNGYHYLVLLLALSSLTLWPIARYRSRRAGPNIDHLYFVPMRFWVYGFGIGAVGCLIASFVDKGA